MEKQTEKQKNEQAYRKESKTSIIKCPMCKQEISNDIKICPHCDYPIG